MKELGVKVEFKRSLSELAEKLGETLNPKLGNHGHSRADYLLAWEKVGEGFTFTLENIKLEKKLRLIKCPPVFFSEISRLLPVFFDEIVRVP